MMIDVVAWFAFALASGALSYGIGRWLFCVWTPLPTIVSLALLACLLRANCFPLFMAAFLFLPMVITSAVGAYFLTTSTPRKGSSHHDSKAFWAFTSFLLLQNICFTSTLLHALYGPKTWYQAGVLNDVLLGYIALSTVSPVLASFVFWWRHKIKRRLPTS